MHEKISNILPSDGASIWLTVLTGMWGALASYLRRLQAGEAFRLVSLMSHLVISIFASLLVGLLCVHIGAPWPLMAMSTGLAGWMGVEAIKIVEARWLARATNSSTSL